MKQKITALFLACVLLLAVMCGCGEETASAVTLRTMSTLGADGEYAVYSSLISEYSTAYPDVYIRDTSVAAADAFRLGAAKEETYSRASAPHVVYYEVDGGLSLLSEYFVSVEEIRELYPDFASAIDPAALDCFRLADGKVYCVPVMGEWSAIVVNQAKLRQYSISVPTDWNSLLDAVFQLSSQGVLPFANAADDCAVILESLIVSYGGESAALLGLQGYSNIISESWQLAATDYAQLCRSGAFAPAALTSAVEQSLIASAPQPEPVSPTDVSSSDVPSATDAAPQELFCQHPASNFPPFYDNLLGADRDRSIRIDSFGLFNDGLAAMIAIDSSELSSINFTGDCRVIPIPTPAGTASGTVIGGFRSGFAITRRAFTNPELRDAAVAFVEQMVSPAAAGQYAALGYLPAITDSSVNYTGAVGDLLSAGSTISTFCLSTRSGAQTARWNTVEKLTAQLYYGLITPLGVCSELSDPGLIWSVPEQAAEGELPDEDTAQS